MKFSVEQWAPEFGAPVEGSGLHDQDVPVALDTEVAADDWTPVVPPSATSSPEVVLFVDGVRRIEARVWIATDSGTRAGICASYAAGVVQCDGHARVVDTRVERGLFTAAPGAEDIATRHARFDVRPAAGDDPETLSLALQARMCDLEVAVVRNTSDGEGLVIVDGPLTGRQDIPNAVGYVKSHHRSYLPSNLEPVVAQLAPGERTPVFVTQTSWSRFSWYLRLAAADGHPWAGVARCEVSAEIPAAQAIELANVTSAFLPGVSSRPHKDPRAPQNLYPIAGLERELRRRLGDREVIYRSLRVAARPLEA